MVLLKVTEVKETRKEQAGESDSEYTTKTKLEPEDGDVDMNWLKIKEEGKANFKKGEKVEMSRNLTQESLEQEEEE